MRLTRMSIELATVFYLLTYLPYMLITRALSTTDNAELGRPLTGLETLPSVLIMGSVMILVFIYASGWYKAARTVKIGRAPIPVPGAWTFLSGIGTALLLFTVPLSLTFEGVSIPFMQLLMRGDVLIIAPLVDLIAGRRVRWFSWVALVLVFIGMALTTWERGGFNLPPLAILTIVLYTLGYFIRIAVMTKIAKNGDEDALKRYFVEEKIVAMPLSILLLALIIVSPLGRQGSELGWGFVEVWTSSAIGPLILLALTFFAVTVFSALILLNPRENTFCVPFERAASIIAGLGAAYALAIFLDAPFPTPAENVGVVLLIAAIALLSVAPRWGKKATHPRADIDPQTASTTQ